MFFETVVSCRDRFQVLDLARGTAIILMISFHFSYNLDYMGLADIRIRKDMFWINYRNLIVTCFVLIAGISLCFSSQKKDNFLSYLQGQKILAACALAVSIATYPIFPDSWIYFGILHFILVARIAGFFFLKFTFSNLVTGLLIVWAGTSLGYEALNSKWINWLGMAADKPYTEDYVPLFPWFGVFLLGIFSGKMILHQKKLKQKMARHYSGKIPAVLSIAGRNSLLIYMVHQPVLMGLMFGMSKIVNN